MLITFEGIDGVGKTTQSKVLVENLVQRGLNTKLFIQPSHGRYGKKIREILYDKRIRRSDNLYNLFLKDREEQVKKEIIPFLEKGYYVVLDRYYLSTFAYQEGYKSLDEMIQDQEKFPIPNLTYIIDLDEKEAIRRLSVKKQLDIFEKEYVLKKVRNRFKYLKEYFKYQSIFILDGMKSMKEISSEILIIFEERVKN